MSDAFQDITGLKRLALSKYYLRLAFDHGNTSREFDVFVSVNLLHEAVETFLVAAAAHVNAPIGSKEDFAGYINKIDQQISPRQLPFRSKLIRLNKARNMAKHDSVVPERSELPGFLTTVREFLEEASNVVFSVEFRSVSLINALPEGRQRDLLKEAQSAFENNEYVNTLIACRKAIFLQYEKSYDAKIFSDGAGTGLFTLGSKVPLYARNQDYLSKHVKEPVDYIVLDHSRIDSDLVKDGLDSHQFWNIWRLTPSVYLADDDRWIVRRELDKMDGPEVAENAAYVLENTVDHFILLARARSRQRMITPTRWTVTSAPSGTRLFLKASRDSEIVHMVPAGVTLNVDSATEGLEEGVTFWKVMSSFLATDKWYYGYAVQDELQFT